ncbi:uncharacterized protein LOC110856561 isoform X2 [Folsomia candida]|uniref:uncharacterized protein LOC110856561 isoform X2 n=1 Tax=Folsomia candida TaxID=158441 RepID=UPI001604E06B|nr:uncharacterized protein LOC110856561 isoform X2 [Folsomia candida]
MQLLRFIILPQPRCQAELCDDTTVNMECPTYNRCPDGWGKYFSEGSGGFRRCTCYRGLTDEEAKKRSECRCNYYITGCTHQPCYSSICDSDCRRAISRCPQDIKNDLCSGDRTDYTRWEKFCPKPTTPFDPLAQQLHIEELVKDICATPIDYICELTGLRLDQILNLAGLNIPLLSCEEQYAILCQKTSTTTRLPILG